MQVSVESSEGLERRMKVELPAEKVDAEIEGRLKEIARSARLDGFRPGKVPLSVVRKRFAAQVRQEVFERMVQSSYFEALAHEKLQPAGEPSIEPLPPVDSGPEAAESGPETVEVAEAFGKACLSSGLP